MSDDIFLLHKTANGLRAHPEILAVRVSREHYLWLFDEIEKLHSIVNGTLPLDDGWCARCGCGNDFLGYAHLEHCRGAK